MNIKTGDKIIVTGFDKGDWYNIHNRPLSFIGKEFIVDRYICPCKDNPNYHEMYVFSETPINGDNIRNQQIFYFVRVSFKKCLIIINPKIRVL